MTLAHIVVPMFGPRSPSRHLGEMYASLPFGPVRMVAPFRSGTVASCIANARNLAAEDYAEIYVFNDADSLCPPDNIREAVRLAAEATGLVFAFTNYCRLSQKTTESLSSWRDAFDAPVEWEMYGSLSSGCVAISRESFLQVGGYDETWLNGYEDYDFALRCAEMFGPNRRVEGDLIHLWHPRPAVEPENGRDRGRFEARWLAPQLIERAALKAMGHGD